MKLCCFLVPALSVIGVAGVGIGGYNIIQHGCPLGGCCEGEAATKIVAVSNETAKGSCCSSEADGRAEVIAAAVVAPVAATSGCTPEEKAACIEACMKACESAATECHKPCESQSTEKTATELAAQPTQAPGSGG